MVDRPWHGAVLFLAIGVIFAVGPVAATSINYVYVGAPSGLLYGIDVDTGEELWRYAGGDSEVKVPSPVAGRSTARAVKAGDKVSEGDLLARDDVTERPAGGDEALATAKLAALQSAVLLKNEHRALPLDRKRLRSLAVIGPLADAPQDQLGTWIFDGDRELSVTPLQAIRELKQDDPGTEVSFRRTLEAYPVKALATIRNQALVTVVDLTALEVEIAVAENLADEVTPGTPAVLTVGGEQHRGTVVRISPEVEGSRVKGRVAFAEEIPAGYIQPALDAMVTRR